AKVRLRRRRPATGQVLARCRAEELTEDPVKLRVAPEARLLSRLLQVRAAAIDRREEAFDAQAVPVFDERNAHFGLERAGEVPGADAHLTREEFAARHRVAAERAQDALDDGLALFFARRRLPLHGAAARHDEVGEQSTKDGGARLLAVV